MKKIKLFTMALAALAIFSCSKEDANKNVAPDAPGQPVFAQFSISLPSATRAGTAGDTHGTAAENTINDIKVYVIGSNRLVEKILEVPAISGTTNIYTTTPAEITTGSKEVIAVVNSASRTAAQFKVGDNLTKIQDALIENVAAATGADVLFTNRPVSVNVVNKNADGTAITKDKPFKISVSVDRAVAKVVVRNGISRVAGVGGMGVGSA
ncbi:MAG: fimbrial protein, partial [Rikenellaceae bacterium]